jgi:hypothetical protein
MPQARRVSNEIVTEPKQLKPTLVSQLRGQDSLHRQTFDANVGRKSTSAEDSFLRTTAADGHAWFVVEGSSLLNTISDRTFTLEHNRAYLKVMRKVVEEL